MEPVPAWGTLPMMLRDRARHHGSAVAVVDGGRQVTLAELEAEAMLVSRALIALGVRAGDRVAVWGFNSATWVAAACGVWGAGGVIVPLSTRYKAIEAADLLAKTGAKVLLLTPGHVGTPYPDLLGQIGGPAARRPISTLPDLEYIAVPRADLTAALAGRPGVLTAEGLLEHAAAVSADEAMARADAITPGDIAEIMATSGTTGTPKGVVLEHGLLLRAYWDWSGIAGLGAGDRYPVFAPFSHGFGLNAGLIASLLRRATMIPIGVFNPDLLMDLIERDRITILAAPPTLFTRLLDELDRGVHDVSSLRVAVCGAATVSPELITRLLERTSVERVINAYGLMEGTVVSMTRDGDPVDVVASSTGRPVPGMTVKIVNGSGVEVPVGERGEILVRGYGVMSGYWREPARTAETVDAQGWLHTGDIGVLDGAGNLSIVDRKKEIFIVSGFNVAPAEVEGLLLAQGDLAQAAVIGMPDETAGESGWAYVVPRPGVAVEPEKLIAWARENMSNYKVPRRVIVVSALPVNANGKVDKQALRAAAAQ